MKGNGALVEKSFQVEPGYVSRLWWIWTEQQIQERSGNPSFIKAPFRKFRMPSPQKSTWMISS